MATQSVSVHFTAIDGMTEVFKRMNASASRFNSGMETAFSRSERVVRSLTPSISGLQKKLGDFGTLLTGFAAFNFLRSSFGVVTRFETGLIGVGKTTGLAGDDLKRLSTDIISTSGKLKTVSSEKLLELAQVAGQLGIKGNENILKFSSTMAKLEKASDVQGEEGAASIARLLTITREGPEVVDRFASTLVGLGNTSAATESEILRVASEVGRSTSAYSLQSTEILGLSAALKSLDIRPESAGTAVGQVFRTLEQATLSGGSSLESFSKVMELTPKQIQETFKKSPLDAFTSFIKGLNRIKKEGGSVTQMMNDLGLSGEIVAKGIIPLAGNYDLLAKKLKDATRFRDDNQALDQEFEDSQKTVASALSAVSNAFDNILISTSTSGSGLSMIQGLLYGVAENMGTIVNVGATLVGLILAANLVMKIWRIGLIAYNIVLGVSTFLMRGNIFALRSSTVAFRSYAIMTALATKVTGGFAVALGIAGAPIWLIALAIIALIAIIAVLITYWDEWGAAVSLLLGPIGFLVSLVMAFHRNWNMIKDAFKNDGILAGLLAIGKTIVDAILMPLQQVLELISGISGMEFAGEWAANLQSFREKHGFTTVEENKQDSPINKDATIQQMNNVNTTTERNSVDVNILTGEGVLADIIGNPGTGVKLTSTQNAWM